MEALLKVDTNRLQHIYKSYNTNEEEIKRNVEILKEWLKKQPHLPQQMPYDGFLEQMLKNSKYRIERTKERIDNYFTMKTLNLQAFQGLANKKTIFPTQNSVGFGLSPIFLENNENLAFSIVKSYDSNIFDFDEFIQTMLAFCEVYLRYNSSASVCYVVDSKGFSLGHFKKIDFVRFRNIMKFFLDGYGHRLTGFHFLNFPVYCNPILALLKSISSAKMVSRIKVHDNLESLHKCVPKYALPEEFGGTASFTIKEITDIADEFLNNQRSFLADSVNYCSNEKLRIGKSKYDAMFGVDGTFKQMNLD